MSDEERNDIVVELDSRRSVPQRSKVKRVVQAFELAWRSNPIAEPILDPQLMSLPTMERVAEVVRYYALKIEYAVSPKGGLRAWVKLNVHVGLVLAVPAVILIPVITFILSGVAGWTQLLRESVENLSHVGIKVFLLILIFAVGGRVKVALFG